MAVAFSTAYLDPPWPESGGGKVKRGADRHYHLMRLRDIERTIRTCELFRIADDAHCWMWVTNNYLPHGIELMRLLGFRYVTNVVWVKMKDVDLTTIVGKFRFLIELATRMLQLGLGQYQRGAHELLLFGVRGQAMLPETKDRFASVVFAPRVKQDGKEKHSAKPPVFYDRIEAVSPGPYLEMFARSRRPGWTSWGNEVQSG